MDGHIRYEAAVVPTSHFEDPGAKVLQLQLWFEVPASADDATARASFEEFLRIAPSFRFRLCAIDAKLPGDGLLTPVPGGTVPIGMADPILTWLDSRATRWTSAETPDGAIDHRSLGADELLASSANWPAPAARTAALSWTLLLPAGEAAVGKAVLPFLDENRPDLVWIAVGPEKLATYLTGPSGTVSVRASPVVEDQADPSSLVDPANGMLRTPGGAQSDEDAHRVHDALGALALRGPSQLSAAHALLNLRWSSFEESDAAIRKERQLGRLVFRATCGLVTLLDPVVLSMIMPGSRSEGPFIGALLAAVDGALAEEADRRTLDETEAERTVQALKARIATYFAAPDETGDASRAAFAQRLRALLPAAAEEGSARPTLMALLDLYVGCQPGTLHQSKFAEEDLDELEERLDREFGGLLQWLEGEEGTEAVVHKVLDLCLEAGQDLPGELTGALKTLGLQRLKQTMSGDFNGADATRAAVGALLTEGLVSAAHKQSHSWSIAELRAVTTPPSSDWFRGRMWSGLWAGGAFGTILAALPAPALGYLAPEDGRPVASELSAAMAAVWEEIGERLLGSSDDSRFSPTTVPLPLPIRIAADQDVDSGDLFARAYSGIGVLIRRDQEPWAHANLATYAKKVAPAGDPDDRPVWVQPLDAVAVNGRRELFAEYQGFPFSEADFAAATPGNDEGGVALHSVDAPDKDQLGAAALQRLPALAYGRQFSVAAFSVLRGGLLPSLLAGDEPWKPRSGPLTIAADYVATQPYSRTTAIGTVKLDAEGPQFPDDPVTGVQPLAHDYPRIALMWDGYETVRDLWRNTDGSGAVELPAEGEQVLVSLDDVMVWGMDAAIGVHVRDRADALTPEHAAARLSAHAGGPTTGGRMELRIRREGGALHYQLKATRGDLTIDVADYAPTATDEGGGGRAAVFVQISLVGRRGPVALSLANPTEAVRGEDGASARDSDKVVLVPPRGGLVGSGDGKRVTLRLRAPRVAYQDFSRWMSNPVLAADSVARPDDAKEMLETLLAGYIGGDRSMADGIANLPDPGVRHLLVELTPLDGVAEAPLALAAKHRGVRRLLPLPQVSLPKIPPTTSHTENRGYTSLSRMLSAFFAGVDHAFDTTWTVGTGTQLSLDPAKPVILVPEGTTAQLTIRPVVPAKLFQGAAPAFDPRLLQWAQGELDEGYVFAGASLTLEAMTAFDGKLKDFADTAYAFIEVRTGGPARGYEVVAAPPGVMPPDAWQWRRFGCAQVATQQWRFMGRPITRWFDPKALAQDFAVGTPALRLDGSAKAAAGLIAAFEDEAFLDRDDDDAQLRNVRLSPLDLESDGTTGVVTAELQQVQWQAPAATMFRHRIGLFSRYAGALASSSDGRVDVVGGPQEAGRDWLRVAMLAEAGRIDLTRPQLRTLMPLTIASDKGTSPPVLAILDEEPLAQGGLADRIAAGIRTSLGFEVPKAEGARAVTSIDEPKDLEDKAEPILELHDARAEFGPDPQLRYTATDAEAAKALTLLQEGPVGLSFDPSSVRAPRFANAALMLTPHMLSAEASKLEPDLQEHFASVVLRRYLDHRWSTNEGAIGIGDGVRVAASRCCWIECDTANTLRCDGKPICSIARSDAAWTVELADRRLTFPTGTRVGALRLSQIDAETARGIALLHQPLANGRATLTVFALPSDATGSRGTTGAPLMLASVEWGSIDAKTAPAFLDTAAAAKAHPMLASAETPMSWVRTGRDSERLTLADASGAREAYDARDVVVEAESGRIAPRFGTNRPLHLIASHEDSDVALEVHRRLGLIRTRPLSGPGQLVETFEAAHVILGATLPAVGDVDAQVRIVEFETRALPIAAGISEAEYQSAHFDLKSIGRPDAGTLGFWIRPIGGYRRVGAGFSLSFDLDGPTGSDWTARRLTIRPEKGRTFDCRNILLCVTKGEARAWFQRADGSFVPSPDPQQADATSSSIKNTFETVRIGELEVRDSTGPLGSWWADVSCLTLKTMPATDADPVIPLDFDWFFTGTQDRPTDAVMAAGLTSMVEVQARVLTATPPIGII